MNIFTLTSIISFFSTLGIGLLFLSKVKSKSISDNFGWTCIASSIWAIGAWNFSIARTEELALFWIKIAHIGIILTPTFYFHWLCKFVKEISRRKIILLYLSSTLCIISNFINPNFYSVVLVFNSFYFFKINLTYQFAAYFIFYLLLYIIFILYAFILLIKFYKTTTGNLRNQVKYFIIASVIAWLGPEGMFLYIIFGVPLYPYSNILIGLYPLILAYAILKYRLMDVRVALTRTSVFIAVYAIVLGIPFWIGYKYHLWKYSTIVMAILATIGPSLFIYLARRAEARILKEERRAHELLKQASEGMVHIHSIKKLLDLIDHITAKTLKLENVSVFLLDENSGNFKLSAVRFKSKYHYSEIITKDDPLTQKLSILDEPLVYGEVTLKAQENKDSPKDPIHEIESQMHKLKAAVIVPSISKNRLLGFLVLGDKVSKRMYTAEDLATLWALSYQAALAIENAIFYEKEKMYLAEESKRQALADMAPGASHQFSNRLSTISYAAEELLDIVENDSDRLSKEEMTAEVKSCLKLIKDQVVQGKEITSAILQKAKVRLEFAKVDITKIIENAKNLIFLRRTRESLAGAKAPEFIVNYPQGLPLLMLCEGPMQDVFENLFNNSIDAIVIRTKRKIDPEGYGGKIKINITQKDKSVIVSIEDNGIGIEKTNIHKMFTPLFTTKATAEKGVVGGSGLGLGVMRSFIEDHGGTISVESEYEKWTRFTITLPLDFNPPK